MEELVTLHIYAEDYDRLTSWQLAGWCKKHGANDFALAAVTVKGAGRALFERFDDMTEQFRLPKAKRRSLTAYGSDFGPNAFIRPTELEADLCLVRCLAGVFTRRFLHQQKH